MMKGSNRSRTALVVVTLAGVALNLPPLSFAVEPCNPMIGTNAHAAADQQDIARAAKSKWGKSQFKNIQVNVDNGGFATLTGSVDLYEYKADAEKRVSKVRRDRCEEPDCSPRDQRSPTKNSSKSSRRSWPMTASAITAATSSTLLVLGCKMAFDVDRDSALSLVSTYPGVKDVIDDIEVDPT